MALSEKQKRHLRTLAHTRKPVVIVGGGGLREAVFEEIDAALTHHELIKVRVNAEDREQRAALIDAITGHCGCERVQQIGHIAVFYRRAEKPRITLP